MDNDYVLEATDLTRRYGGFVAVDNVTIRLRRGEIQGLIGPNGAGKSTLMDLLSGRGAKCTGTVMLDGVDITRASPRHRRLAGLARSFQRTNIFPELRIAEQVHLAARAVNADNTDEVLDALSLAPLASQVAADVSYGDQRRLDLALALVGRPRVLLLDEPAAGLSRGESLLLAQMLRDLATRWKVSVLIVEHDMAVIFSVCDRLTVLHLGRVLAQGLPEEVRAMREVKVAYLGDMAA